MTEQRHAKKRHGSEGGPKSQASQRFKGKSVLVTGGTSRIGLTLAEAFMAEGALVTVCARTRSALETFEAAHPDAQAIVADVRDPNAQVMLLDQIAKRFVRLDILVNNAGRLVERDFVKSLPDLDGMAAEFELNLLAPIQLSALALTTWPTLEALAFVTSGYALVSPTRAPTYGAAKAGLRAFADGLRRQLAPRGTHVLEVIPPMVDGESKVSPETVAAVTLASLERGKPVALAGDTRALPTLLRLAPRAVAKRVAAT